MSTKFAMLPIVSEPEKAPGNLSFVPRPSGSTLSPKFSIIVVPDIGPKPISNSRRSTNPWTWLYEVCPESQVLEYNYSLDETGPPIWTSLLRRSEELLKILTQSATSMKGGNNCSMVFVCHGLGGLIVKRTFTILYERYFDPTYQKMINVFSGLVFLGTPHPTYKNEQRWPQLGLILRSKIKVPKVVLAQAEMEAAIVANVSQKFEETGLEVLTVSVFEQRKTKIGEGLFRSTVLLVDRDLAQTSLRNEVLIGCDTDHRDVWNVSSEKEVLHELKMLFSAALFQNISSSIAPASNERNSAVEAVNHDIWKSTIGSEAGHRPQPPAISTPYDKTPEANVGSSDGFELIPVIMDITAPKLSTHLPAYLLKAQEINPDFYGREDIMTLIDQALLPSSRASIKGSKIPQGTNSFALCGLGGVGKTQTAIAYAHSRKVHFDAVFWAQADGTVKLDESYKKIALELGLLDPSDVGDLVISRNIMMQWLSAPHAQASTTKEKFPEAKEIHWLLILDNADNLEDLRDFWPISPNGSILITSRDPLAKSYSHLSDGMDLQPFNSDDAAALLVKLSGNKPTLSTEKKALEMLSFRLGGLPLAIVQFAANIKRRDNTYKEMLELVSEERTFASLLRLKLKAGTEPDTASLADIWAVENLTPSATRLLEVFAILDPDGIDEFILTSGSATPITPMNFGLKDFPETKSLYYEARTELWKSSLIVRNKQLEQISLHRLTQDVVRASMSDEQFQSISKFTLQLLSEAWPEDWMAHKTGAWTIVEKLTSHVIKLHLIYKARPTVVSFEISQKLARLLQKTGWYFYERGSFDTALQNLTAALDIYKEAPKEVPEQLADTLVSLSACTKEMNDPPTHMFYAQWQFDVRKQHPSKDILLNGMAYNQLASAFGQASRYEEAIELAKKGWAINITSPEYLAGKYYPFYAMLYQVLPLMALNRNDEAIAKLSDAIAWRQSKYGRDDTESFVLGYALHMLANIKFKQGHVAESTELWIRALANYRATMGNNYHRTGTVCCKLAAVYANAGQYETASIFFDEAERCHSLLSYFRPELARTKFLKSEFLKNLGSEDAAKIYDEAVALLRDLSPGKSREGTPEAKDFDNVVFIWSR